MDRRVLDRLARRQRLHAWAITVVPPAGTAVAIALAARDGLRPLDLGLLAAMYALSMAGVIVGFHRMASHHAFEARPAVRTALLGLGSMAAQGPLFYWVTNHRRHHHLSDQPGDPHSPVVGDDGPLHGLRGLLHGHIGWTFGHRITNVFTYGKDLFRDRALGRINRLYYPLVVAGLVVPAAIGGLASWSLYGALTGLLWGGLVRLFIALHVVFAVNSIGHAFGARAFETRDQSRNVWWLAVPSLGDGWHNNHHAFPTSAWAGLAWWQVDLGGWLIAGLARLGLVSSVRRPSPAAIAAKKRSGAGSVRPQGEEQVEERS